MLSEDNKSLPFRKSVRGLIGAEGARPQEQHAHWGTVPGKLLLQATHLDPVVL